MLKTEMNRTENQYRDKKKDYSLINYSKTQVRGSYYYDYEKQIKKIKYPTYSISNAENLQAKIQSFNDQNVRNQLKKQLAKLNSYRKIRGDGNCFFRALAFGCLASVKQPSLKNCFPFLSSICLTCCIPESIPAVFKKFYDHQFLLKMLSKDWEPVYLKFYEQYKNNAKKTLVKVFDEFPFLDFIVILYFRAVCLKGLWKLEQNLKEFLLGTEEQSIRTYSEETEGVSINICSITLNVAINVYEIRKGAIKVYHYDDIQKSGNQLSLLFYENHYDVIEHNEQIDDQKNSLSTTNYYSDLNRKMVRGVCLQCNIERNVFEDSFVCSFCFDLVERMAKKYDNSGKRKRGRCQDCYSLRDDILEDLGICEKCVAWQNQEQQRRRKKQQRLKAEKQKKLSEQRSPQKRKNQQKSEMVRGKCVSCQLTLDIDNQTGLCSYCKKMQQKAKDAYGQKSPQKTKKYEEKPSAPKYIHGRCIQCKYTSKINSETNLCAYCQRAQQRALNRLKSDQERKQVSQKIIKNTNQKTLDSISPSKKPSKVQENADQNYYSKYMIKQGKKLDSNKIGTQIRQEGNQKNRAIREESLPEWQRDQKISLTQKDHKSLVVKKCQYCKKQDCQIQDAPLCLNCYKIVFSIFNYCKGCSHKMHLHQDTYKCAGCHYKQDKSTKPSAQKDHKSLVVKKCQYCKKQDCQIQDAPLCLICYKIVFSNYNYCKNCLYKSHLHQDTYKCAGCHYKQDKSTKPSAQIPSVLSTNPSMRGMTPKKQNKCIKCNEFGAYKQSLCSSCYSKYHCMNCKQIKYTELIVGGKCRTCRTKN